MTYRLSALGSAAVRMWRGWRVLIPAIVGSAILQAFLLAPPVTVADSATLWALAAASYLVGLVTYAVLTAVSLAVVDGRVGWTTVTRRIRAHGLAFAAWTTVVCAVAVVGWSLSWIPGVVVAVLGAFVPLAALDGRPPVGVSLLLARRRPWRWLLTAAVVVLLCVVGATVAGFTMFFLRGSLGAFVVTVVATLVLAWVTTAWALIYRDALAEAPGEPA